MADSILVRFDDELSQQLRERARQDQKSITGFINDAVKAYLDQQRATDKGQATASERTKEGLQALSLRLADAHRGVTKQEDVWPTLAALLDCIEIVSYEGDAISDRIKWDQFKYAGANGVVEENEARRLFAAEYEDVANRDWTWYLRSCKSAEEAKSIWLRQRRRYGVPIPPEVRE